MGRHISFSWMFDSLTHWLQQIDSGNNSMRLSVIERFGQMSPLDVEALTKRRPDWRKELERAFDRVQDAIEPAQEIACEMELILADRESASEPEA